MTFVQMFARVPTRHALSGTQRHGSFAGRQLRQLQSKFVQQLLRAVRITPATNTGRKVLGAARQLAQQIPPDLFEDSVRTLNALRAGTLVDDPPAQLGVLFRKSVQPYLISWFRYDPPKQAANIDEPLLLIYGTTDIQVEVSNGEALAAAHADARLVIIEGMNHVLKMVSGEPGEQMPSYSDPDLPLADGVARAISDFVTETTTRSP